MSEANFWQRRLFESAAARYRMLLANTRDPNRRRMLEEMIARELAAANRLDVAQPIELHIH